jgi:predicted transcriptional regulator
MSNINENRSRGYIALFRSLQKHWLYPDGRAFTEYEAWIDLLMQANHKTRTVRVKNQLIKCKRGESVRSISQWAERWNWSRSKVYRFLNLLQDDGMIETVSETVTSRITICNYESYQDPKNNTETQVKQGRNDGETQVKRPRNASETVSNTNKNVNNANNGKNEKNERESTHAPTREEVLKFFLSNKGFKEWADEFFEHYTTAQWQSSNGNRFDWRVRARQWIRENRLSANLDEPYAFREKLREIDEMS